MPNRKKGWENTNWTWKKITKYFKMKLKKLEETNCKQN